MYTTMHIVLCSAKNYYFLVHSLLEKKDALVTSGTLKVFTLLLDACSDF